MKKIIVAAIVTLMLLALCIPALALTIEPSLEPTSPAVGETVRVLFRVQNTAEFELENITIEGYGLNGAQRVPGTVLPEGLLRFSLPNVRIDADVLGQALTYTLRWTENGEDKSQSITVPVGGAGDVEMELTRKASKTSGAIGDKVVLTYTLKNPSASLPMTNIEIKDSIAGSTAIRSDMTLEAGESQDVTYEYTLGNEDAISVPTITYHINNEIKTASAEPLTITVVNVKLGIDVVQGENTAEGTNFTITLSNTGNQTISKIQVTDELGNNVNSNRITLEAGKKETLTYLVKSDIVRNVSFVVTGTDALGQPFEDNTREYPVMPYIDPDLVKIKMTVSTLEQLTDSGRMKVRFTIENNSAVPLSTAVVSEEQLGNIFSLNTLPVGQSIREEELVIGTPRELVFTLTAADLSGAAHSFVARLTADYVEAPTPPPEETPEPDQSPDPGQEAGGGISGTLTTVLIVLAALMAIAGIALLVLSIYEKKNNARMDDDYEDEDEAEDKDVRRYQSSARPYAQQPSRDELDTPAKQPGARPYAPPPAGRDEYVAPQSHGNTRRYAPQPPVRREAPDAPQSQQNTRRYAPQPPVRREAPDAPQSQQNTRPYTQPPVRREAPVAPQNPSNQRDNPQASPVRNRVRRVQPGKKDGE